MDSIKFEAFCEEFPFLRELVEGNIEDLDSITVKRVDENLLNLRPRLLNHYGHKGETYDSTSVHFYFNNILEKDVVARDIEITSNYAHFTPEYRNGERIIEAINRAKIATKLQYVIVEEKYKHAWDGDYPQNSWNITIYKPPKNTTFTAEIAKAREKARAQVRAEANF